MNEHLDVLERKAGLLQDILEIIAQGGSDLNHATNLEWIWDGETSYRIVMEGVDGTIDQYAARLTLSSCAPQQLAVNVQTSEGQESRRLGFEADGHPNFRILPFVLQPAEALPAALSI